MEGLDKGKKANTKVNLEWFQARGICRTLDSKTKRPAYFCVYCSVDINYTAPSSMQRHLNSWRHKGRMIELKNHSKTWEMIDELKKKIAELVTTVDRLTVTNSKLV